MTTVLKLGGSVVTDKETPETVDETTLARLADAIAGHEDIVVVHGGGSFGHHYADRHDVSTTDGTHDARAVRDVHDTMCALNDAVVNALATRDVPAVPVRPLSAAYRTHSGSLTALWGQVSTLLGEGFVPVTHGDVVAHAGAGATIVSGDELVVELASALDADRVGVCSAVPGVLDTTGEVVPRVESFADVADALGGSEATDVTGGMAAKVRELLALDAPAYVFGVDAVEAFLAGDEPGTQVG